MLASFTINTILYSEFDSHHEIIHPQHNRTCHEISQQVLLWKSFHFIMFRTSLTWQYGLEFHINKLYLFFLVTDNCLAKYSLTGKWVPRKCMLPNSSTRIKSEHNNFYWNLLNDASDYWRLYLLILHWIQKYNSI